MDTAKKIASKKSSTRSQPEPRRGLSRAEVDALADAARNAAEKKGQKIDLSADEILEELGRR